MAGQPLDLDYMSWENFLPAAGENPVISIARRFAGTASTIWGGWAGYDKREQVQQQEEDEAQLEAGEITQSEIDARAQEGPIPEQVTQGLWYSQPDKWGTTNASAIDADDGASVLGPWSNYNYLFMLEPSYTARNTLNPCGTKTDSWKEYKNATTNRDLATRWRYHRKYVSQMLDQLGSTAFSVLIYRFLKANIGKDIRDYIDKIPPADRDLPQPELLGFLYQKLKYLTDLKAPETMEYLYTRMPLLFRWYTPAFQVLVRKSKETIGGVTYYGCDDTRTGNIQILDGYDDAGNPIYKYVPAQPTVYVLQFPVGLTKNTEYSQAADIPEFGGAAIYYDDWVGNEDEENGLDWWIMQFEKRLPDSFLTMDSLAYNLKFQLGIALQGHIDHFLYTYDTYAYFKDQPGKDIGLPTGITYLSNSEVLDWWEDFTQATWAYASAEEKQAAAQAAEVEGVENLDLEACEDPFGAPPPSSGCQACIPDQNALIPDWTTLNDKEPFLNGKTCEYSITMRSSKSTLNDAASLFEIMASMTRPGLKKLLDHHGKDSTETSLDKFIQYASASDYHVPYRANLKIKVLVTFPYSMMEKVPPPPPKSSEEKNQERQEGNPAAESPLEVVLRGVDLRHFFAITSHGMKRYVREYQRATKPKKLKKNPNAIRAGLDFWALRNGLRKYKKELISFLRRHGFKINPTAKKTAGLDKVTLKFDEDYKLLSVWANKLGCPEVQLEAGFVSFKNTNPINNETTSALVANLPSIITDFTKSQPLNYGEFTDKYIRPPMPEKEREFLDEQPDNAGSEECNVGKVIANVFKPVVAIGAQAAGEALKIGDIFAEEYMDALCAGTEEIIEEDRKLGQAVNAEVERIRNQWHAQIEAGDAAFTGLADTLNEVDGFFDMFSEVIDTLQLCGLLALIENMLDCVVAGFDVKVSAKTLLKATINNFTEKQTETLFLSLNPGLQKLLREAVKDLTEIPFPWEAGYRPGSYDSDGANARIDAIKDQRERFKYQKKHFEKHAAVILDDKRKHEEELDWPQGYDDWFRVSIPDVGAGGVTIDAETEFLWTDMDTLEYRRLGPDGTSMSSGNLNFANAPRETFVGRPFLESTHVPSTSPDATGEVV